jgi:Fur family ferric uptake transcriptional regulator
MADDTMLRDTKQRRAILEELQSVNTHPTADEVYEMVRKRIPRISLGTVYRNLEILSENGMIMRLEHAAGCYRFDGNPDNHYHIRCTRCGCVSDISDEPIEEIEEAIIAKTDFKIISHRLEYLGICPKCQEPN